MSNYELNPYHNIDKAKEELLGERFIDFQQVFPDLARKVLLDKGWDPYKRYEFYIRTATEEERRTLRRPMYGAYVIEVRELPDILP